MLRPLLSISFALLMGASFACGPRPDGRRARTAATAETPDGGLPPPPPSGRKGVFMPGDTGMGAGPSGTTTSTGTNGQGLGPTIGGGN